MVGRVLAVVLYEIGEGYVEQIGIAERGDEPVVVVIVVCKEQLDEVVGVRTQY